MSTSHTSSQAVASSRLTAIDIIRGYCIVGMVASHLTIGSVLSRATHLFPGFDGASGFVLLSGLVLGIVQQRRLARSSLRSVQVKTLRRTALIYVAQLSLVLLGLTVGIFAVNGHQNVLPTSALGVDEAVLGSLTFTLAPPAGSVLRLYVVLLLLACGAYWLLSRGRWALTLAASLALYLSGYLFPSVTSFQRWGIDQLGANWATWQLVFVGALLIGWHWTRLRVADRVRAYRWGIVAGCIVFLVGAYGGERLVPILFVKTMFAPGRVLTAFVVVLFLFAILDWLLARTPAWLWRPIRMVGTRSLDSYIIQAGVAVIIPSFVAYDASTMAGTAMAVAALALCWGWAEFRRVVSRTERRVAAPVPVDRAPAREAVPRRGGGAAQSSTVSPPASSRG